MQLITVVQSKCPAVNINTKHAESMAPTVNHTNGCRHPSQRGNQSPLWYTGKCKEISHSLSQHISCLISWMDTGLNKTGFPPSLHFHCSDWTKLWLTHQDMEPPGHQRVSKPLESHPWSSRAYPVIGDQWQNTSYASLSVWELHTVLYKLRWKYCDVLDTIAHNLAANHATRWHRPRPWHASIFISLCKI